MHLGVIADDVTGGTDLASVLRRSRFSVVQTLGLPQSAPPRADATAAARAAAAYLADAGARQIYFKYCSTFDSTDRGNIGPVIDALLEQLRSPFTVACPAYPALGRTVYLGHLFVGGQLLSESSMRHHPLTPMTDANLLRVLARQSQHAVGLVALEDVEQGEAAIRDRFGKLADEGRRVAIVDAVLDRHVDAIGCACKELPLVTGGAALGGALARAALGVRSKGEVESFPRPPAPVAVLSGSGSAATLEQVQRLSEVVPHRSIDPLTLASDEHALAETVDWACRQARRGHLLITSTVPPEAVQHAQRQLGRAEAAALLEGAFGIVAAALAAEGVRSFIVAGGETAGAVLTALGVKMLGFGDEIEPGVPWTRSLDPEGFCLALKSGNFGGPDFFVKALAMTQMRMA